MRIVSSVRAPGSAERTNSVENFLLILTSSAYGPANEIRLFQEAFLLPPEAEFWSRGKQMTAMPAARRKVEQVFPATGDSVGFAVAGESELAPLVSSLHTESLLSVLSGKVKRLQRGIQMKSPVHAESPSAVVTIEVVDATSDRMTFSAIMIAPDQSWADGDHVVTFNARRSETIVADCNRGTMIRREGSQETIIRSDNGFERKEAISYSLRGADSE